MYFVMYLELGLGIDSNFPNKFDSQGPDLIYNSIWMIFDCVNYLKQYHIDLDVKDILKGTNTTNSRNNF